MFGFFSTLTNITNVWSFLVAVCAIAALVLIRLRFNHFKNLIGRIEKLPPNGRVEAIRTVLREPAPPQNMSAEEYITYRQKQFEGRLHLYSFLFRVLVFIVIACIIGIPVLIFASSFSQKPVNTLATPTPLIFPPSGIVTIEDPLRDNVDLRWETGSSGSNGSSPGDCEFSSEGYQVTATNYFHLCNDQIDDFANFALQVSMQVGTSAGGIFFRWNNPNGYFFAVDDLGNYEVVRVDNATGHYITEINQQNSPRKTYTLGVLADGPLIHLFINGIERDSFRDPTYTHGGIALFTDGDYQPHVPNTKVVFTNLKIWRL